MTKQTVAACFVVYNEERHLEDALKSVRGVVDEIHVLHDGPCTDQTLTIARKYTRFVSETKIRVGDAALLRYQSIRNAGTDWVLILDADERLSKHLQRFMSLMIRDTDADIISLKTELWDGHKRIMDKPFNNWARTMLYKKRAVRNVPVPFNGTLTAVGTERRYPFLVLHRPNTNAYSRKGFRGKIRLARLEAHQKREQRGITTHSFAVGTFMGTRAYLKHVSSIIRQGCRTWTAFKVSHYLSLYYFHVYFNMYNPHTKAKKQ